MFGFFKKFLRLIANSVDLNTLYVAGRSANNTLGKNQFKLNEKESEVRQNSPVPNIEHRHNMDIATHHEAQEKDNHVNNSEQDLEMLEYTQAQNTPVQES